MRAIILTAVVALVVAAPANAGRLTRADRAAINRTFDVFVASALRRDNVAASYDVVTPQLRAGATRAQWANGNIPLYPYAARGTTFHNWTIDYVQGNEVGFQLMLEPRNPRQDSITFNGAVKEIRGRWLVDSFTPVATFATEGAPKVVGPHDFAAPSTEEGSGVPRLGAVWIALPASLLGLGLLVLLGFLVVGWWRGRTSAPSAADRARHKAMAERLRARRSESR
jgi:hypothetical protein